MNWEDDEPDAAQVRVYRSAANQSWGERLFDAVEIALQVFLRYLSGFVDFIDRLVSFFEPREGNRDFPGENRDFEGFRGDNRDFEGFRGDNRDNGVVERERRSWFSLISGIRGGLSALLPQDRNSFWVSSIVVLLACFVFLGFRTGFRLFRIVEVVEDQPKTHSKRLLLPDGRYIFYREHGVSADKAKHSALVVQGFTSSKSTGIAGVNTTLLQQFMIRVVAYDLAGFGRSSPHVNHTLEASAYDMAKIANILRLGERFWLIVRPGGGPYAWAAIRYIPERLSGVVMLAPVGNPYKGEVTMEDIEETASKEWSPSFKLILSIARRFPSVARLFVDRREIKERITKINEGLYATVADQEEILFEQREFISFWEQNLRDTVEKDRIAALAAEKVQPLEELLRLLNGGWSFGLRNLIPKFNILPSLSLPSLKLNMQSEKETPSVKVKASESWQVFKFKLFLVGVVIVILLLVLR